MRPRRRLIVVGLDNHENSDMFVKHHQDFSAVRDDRRGDCGRQFGGAVRSSRGGSGEWTPETFSRACELLMEHCRGCAQPLSQSVPTVSDKDRSEGAHERGT